MRANPSRDDLGTRLLEVARARELNAEAIRGVSQQLLEIRAAIRHHLETPWPEGPGSTVGKQERVNRLGELLLRDLSTQEELGSQVGAGLAITARMRSVVMDMHNQGLEVSDLLSRLDQVLSDAS